MRWHGEDGVDCPSCGTYVGTDAKFCPECGAELPEEPPTEDDEEWHRGFGDPDADYVEEPEQPQQQASSPQPGRGQHVTQPNRPPLRPGSPRAGYAHLVGSIYLEKRAPASALLYFLAAVFLLVPRDTFVRFFREQMQWLLVNYPDLFLTFVRNYQGLGVFFLVGAFALQVSVDPTPKR
jgi:hypothetical protein